MTPLAALALGLPDFYLMLPIATVTVAVLSVAMAFYAATYARAGFSAMALALAWVVVAIVFGVRPEFAFVLATVLVVICVAVHMLGRAVRRRA